MHTTTKYNNTMWGWHVYLVVLTIRLSVRRRTCSGAGIGAAHARRTTLCTWHVLPALYGICIISTSLDSTVNGIRVVSYFNNMLQPVRWTRTRPVSVVAHPAQTIHTRRVLLRCLKVASVTSASQALMVDHAKVSVKKIITWNERNK